MTGYREEVGMKRNRSVTGEEFYRWPGMRVLQSSLERHGREWAVQGRVARIVSAFRN